MIDLISIFKKLRRTALAAAFIVPIVPTSAFSEDAPASAWAEGFNNKLRLVAGRTGAADAPLYAGIELHMPKDWKTYWRNPGEAGGIPPSFDFSASENVSDVRVLYPAPSRLTDKSGTNIGYKDSVVFPVAFKVKDASKPAVLKLKSEYGICKDICVPAEANVELELDSKTAAQAPEILSGAVEAVPRLKPRDGSDPVLTSWKLDTSGAKPLLKLEVADPGGAEGDAFLEAPDGLYVPLPKKLSTDKGRMLYEVDLSDGADIAALKGKSLTVTLTGAKGQSETVIAIEK